MPAIGMLTEYKICIFSSIYLYGGQDFGWGRMIGEQISHCTAHACSLGKRQA